MRTDWKGDSGKFLGDGSVLYPGCGPNYRGAYVTQDSSNSMLKIMAFYPFQFIPPLWLSWSLQWRHGLMVAFCSFGGTEYSSICMESWGRSPLSSYLHHSLAPSKEQGGNTAPPINRKLHKDLLSMAPPTRTRPSFLLSQSLPSQSFHKPLILLHQRADSLKTTITET